MDDTMSLVLKSATDGQSEITIESKGNTETLLIDEFIQERREIKEGDTLSRLEINEMEDDQQIYEAYQIALDGLDFGIIHPMKWRIIYALSSI
ncbi:hypothetical protein MGH68_12805 [Erysipelothrix sp. D19-032]